MEREDIIINGISVNNLKAQRDAIRQGASKIIAENVELAKTLTRKIVEAEDKEEVDNLAKEAYEALDTANLLSGVSGVSYYLPYYEEYGDDNDNICSSLLENSENELLHKNDEVNKLCRLFYTMESQSRDWHASTC
jgi:fibronectin type 3 domain-containing protein